MDDREFESLIRLAVESETLDDPAAPDPRSAACLSMRRLETLVRADLSPTVREQHHLDGCVLCGARLGAFRTTRHERIEGEPPTRNRRLAMWLVRSSAAAAAACLLLVLHLWQTSVDSPGKTGREYGADVEPVAVAVCHEPSGTNAGSPRIDRFEATCDVACGVVAVLRVWDEACQCLDWRLHEWDEEGRTLAQLDPDELLEIALNVTGDPPIKQLLVVATSRKPGDLPATANDAELLLQCLNDVAPPTCTVNDTSSFASAVRECLPSSVTLVEETFFVD